MPEASRTLPGLRAKLDRLVYFHDKEQLAGHAAHVFIYFITISNLADRSVTLKGRRWVLHESTGHRQVIEGEGIVGEEPTIESGERFSYNSYHITHCNCRAEGAFHGIDAEGNPIRIPIPGFDMNLPTAPDAHSDS